MQRLWGVQPILAAIDVTAAQRSTFSRVGASGNPGAVHTEIQMVHTEQTLPHLIVPYSRSKIYPTYLDAQIDQTVLKYLSIAFFLSAMRFPNLAALSPYQTFPKLSQPLLA
jgi:hypothetical protein